MAILFIGWGILLAVAFIDGRLRAPEEAETSPGGDERRGVLALAALAALLAGVRAVLAINRGPLERNVDEWQYAVTAIFAERTGESLFSWAWNLSGVHLVYLLNDAARPFAAIDAATSLAVGLTAFLLGFALLRAGAGAPAALLAAGAYGVGLLPFEGLTSNKEPWVNLALAAWLVVRLGPAGTRRQLAAGACLGLAAVMKEQALLFVLAEPLLGALERRRDETPDWRAWGKDQALAAAGFWLVYAVWLLLFAVRGQAGAYARFLVSWGAAGGTPFADEASGAATGAGGPAAPVRLAAGWFPLLLGPITALGLAAALRVGGRPRSRPALAAAALLVPAAIASAIGLRFFGHYLMLFLPGLALLFGLRAVALYDELRTPGHRRTFAAALLLVLILLGLGQARLLVTTPAGRAMATGQAASGQDALDAIAAAEQVRERTPEGSPILVWGWRPEIYGFADRPPATRMLGGLSAGMAQAPDDLQRWPAAAVLVRRGASREDRLFALEHHPRLAARLIAEYQRTQLRGWDLWLPDPKEGR